MAITEFQRSLNFGVRSTCACFDTEAVFSKPDSGTLHWSRCASCPGASFRTHCWRGRDGREADARKKLAVEAIAVPGDWADARCEQRGQWSCTGAQGHARVCGVGRFGLLERVWIERRGHVEAVAWSAGFAAMRRRSRRLPAIVSVSIPTHLKVINGITTAKPSPTGHAVLENDLIADQTMAESGDANVGTSVQRTKGNMRSEKCKASECRSRVSGTEKQTVVEET